MMPAQSPRCRHPPAAPSMSCLRPPFSCFCPHPRVNSRQPQLPLLHGHRLHHLQTFGICPRDHHLSMDRWLRLFPDPCQTAQTVLPLRPSRLPIRLTARTPRTFQSICGRWECWCVAELWWKAPIVWIAATCAAWMCQTQTGSGTTMVPGMPHWSLPRMGSLTTVGCVVGPTKTTRCS